MQKATIMQIKEDLRFPFTLLFHPIRGFGELKQQKRGRVWVAFLILLLWVFTNVFEHQVTSFLFNKNAFVPADLLTEIRNVALITILILLGNWSITTLMEGEGNFQEIFIVIGYSALPHILIRIPLALLSNLLSFAEKGYADALLNLTWVLFFGLLFIGIMIIHQYTVAKAVATSLLTLAGIVIILFLAFIFLMLFWQMWGFLEVLGKEIQMRL